ncbi:hypothetical protein Rmag_0260 [Candidatus Ruthia magnifica str. Cm (Calyptogena magnifica)]|uniref:Uncharacterized protein n=1 Tax=Ruthia magnifica subsp. Calyptogena magnifica TaxID=413404 RepID=A1AVT5_RUTMC|nr:hypothetical protein [Candidatus Ruthturnera calyptogenae]ABL02042.1 hypothetical protein Rmag_0260 [Candidatus Ruthia magnifica str. Cm (Calyptogena magnifica)]
MINKTLGLVVTFALVGSVMAGGDDLDMGPVEPIFDKVVVKSEHNIDTMILTDTSKVIGQTITGAPVTIAAHEACKDRLNLFNTNIEKFKQALASGFLYNTGPLNEMGTLFSPKRWKDYFFCVENHQ